MENNFYHKMKKGAILLTHFGTTHEDTRKKTLDIINQKFIEQFNKLDFYQVFTSRIINRILKKRGIEVFDTSQILEYLKNEGYTDLIVQPTYIINGIEMDVVKTELQSYSKDFNQIRIGTPLLTDFSDYIEVIGILSEEVGVLKEDEAVVFVGHGSHHPATSAYAMFDYLAKDLEKSFYVGTIEGYPSIENVLKFLQRDNKKKVTLMPLMFVAGEHAKNDIAEDWSNYLTEKGYEVSVNLKGLGEIEKIQDMFVKHAKHLENNPIEDMIKKKFEYQAGKERC
ncbi:MAG: sirohydrochlorin cobaltochelatase [Fusobacteriaceae bacterium]